MLLFVLTFVAGALAGWVTTHMVRRGSATSDARSEIERRYDLFTRHLAASVVIRDASGQITYCSPYTEFLTGYSISEILDTPGDFFETIVLEDDRPRYRRSFAMLSLDEHAPVQYRFFHKSGLEMWAETRVIPIFSDEGALTSSLSISFDITLIARTQQQLREINKDLQDFTYMVSHDLKSPLVTVKGMVHVLECDYGPSLPPEMRELLTHITRAVERIERLVASVIEYSRIGLQGFTVVPVPLYEVMLEVLHDHRSSIDRVGGEIVVEEELPTVSGERLRLYQVMSNLVGNAVKYREPSRQLRIEISVVPHRSRRFISCSVKDNGRGIPPEFMDSIFRPFQRAHGSDIEGTGIGLASVKKIIEKLGGTIEVRSTVGIGSEFIVTLRRAAQ